MSQENENQMTEIDEMDNPQSREVKEQLDHAISRLSWDDGEHDEADEVSSLTASLLDQGRRETTESAALEAQKRAASLEPKEEVVAALQEDEIVIDQKPSQEFDEEAIDSADPIELEAMTTEVVEERSAETINIPTAEDLSGMIEQINEGQKPVMPEPLNDLYIPSTESSLTEIPADEMYTQASRHGVKKPSIGSRAERHRVASVEPEMAVEPASISATPVTPKPAAVVTDEAYFGDAPVREKKREKKQREKAARMSEKNKPRPRKGSYQQIGLVTMTNPTSQAAEQFRTIRTNIQFSGIDQPLESVLITSSGPSEGKSTTSANIAVAWANQGVRTLLVDADMRKPTIHNTFHVGNTLGLTSLLTRRLRLRDAIQETAVPYLDVLTSGPIPPNPSELLNTRKMDRLIEALKKHYDFIIFDAPPMLGIADAQILASKVDGTILVVRQNVTEKNAVIEAKEILEKSRSRILGTVLNDIKERHNGASYTGYYGYTD